MFSVCSHLGGGVRSVSRWGGGQVQPAGEGGSGQSADRGGSGQSADMGGGVRSSQWGGVRSVSWGGGQVQPAGGGGGSGQSADGGGVRSSQGGVSILRPLGGGMPLAFTQEDFLVRPEYLIWSNYTQITIELYFDDHMQIPCREYSLDPCAVLDLWLRQEQWMAYSLKYLDHSLELPVLILDLSIWKKASDLLANCSLYIRFMLFNDPLVT